MRAKSRLVEATVKLLLPVQCNTDTPHWHLPEGEASIARRTAVGLVTDIGSSRLQSDCPMLNP